jgi:hypothetical protein|tara:strand:+ start:109 stop:312 length:204 start_codon:yes stop_codon:yes gene_type:complete
MLAKPKSPDDGKGIHRPRVFRLKRFGELEFYTLLQKLFGGTPGNIHPASPIEAQAAVFNQPDVRSIS